MRLDRANRSLLVFAGIALLFAATVLCGAVGGVLLPMSLSRMAHGGLAALWSDRASLLAPLVLIVLTAVGLGLGARARSAFEERLQSPEIGHVGPVHRSSHDRCRDRSEA